MTWRMFSKSRLRPGGAFGDIPYAETVLDRVIPLARPLWQTMVESAEGAAEILGSHGLSSLPQLVGLSKPLLHQRTRPVFASQGQLPTTNRQGHPQIPLHLCDRTARHVWRSKERLQRSWRLKDHFSTRAQRPLLAAPPTRDVVGVYA